MSLAPSRPGATPHYVTDPECLLAGTGYLMDVSMHGDRRDDDDGGRWRLLVVEDAAEPLGRLHRAVCRPGCCWAQVGFAPFAPAVATAWLAHHGCEETVHAPATLAELYARFEGRTVGRGAAGRGLRLRRQARSKRKRTRGVDSRQSR